MSFYVKGLQNCRQPNFSRLHILEGRWFLFSFIWLTSLFKIEKKNVFPPCLHFKVDKFISTYQHNRKSCQNVLCFSGWYSHIHSRSMMRSLSFDWLAPPFKSEKKRFFCFAHVFCSAFLSISTTSTYYFAFTNFFFAKSNLKVLKQQSGLL